MGEGSRLKLRHVAWCRVGVRMSSAWNGVITYIIEVCEVGRAWPVLLVISMPNAVCTLYSVISAVFKLGKQSHYIPIVLKRQIVIKIHLKFIKCFGISFVVITAYQCRLA